MPAVERALLHVYTDEWQVKGKKTRKLCDAVWCISFCVSALIYRSWRTLVRKLFMKYLWICLYASRCWEEWCTQKIQKKFKKRLQFQTQTSFGGYTFNFVNLFSHIDSTHEAHLTVCEGDCEEERLSELQKRKRHTICPTYSLTS